MSTPSPSPPPATRSAPSRSPPPTTSTAAAEAARAAQAEWARAPHFVRAAVLRKAGDLFTAHADELHDWLVRESGSIPGKADFELHVAAQECYEAAALASRPAGQVLPSRRPACRTRAGSPSASSV